MSLEVSTLPANVPGLAPDTAHRGEYSALSPSARTSFTRVDISANESDTAEVHYLSPAEDDGNVAQAETETSIPQTVQVSLTFLLVSGRRRNMTFEPETTVGRVKELVWNAWPSDWQDERPPAPSYLRILYLGKILQDDDSLLKVGFPTQTQSPAGGSMSPAPLPTIVHLSIRSHPPAGVRDAPKKMNLLRSSTTEGEGGVQSAGCCSGCILC
ncbi:hypothetical protein BDW22DRAFT_1433188 [Trametopsis cervina]|nr:hypothetical protein BDW22DRAFT_1433188 [Trametopsis cervina]